MLGINVLTALYTAVVFIPTPYGEWIRPMGFASVVLMIAVFSFCLGAFLSLIDAGRGKFLFAMFGFLLSLMPYPLALSMMVMFVRVKGLHIEP